MWLGYLDETGNTGDRLDDPDNPTLVLAAVLVHEEQVQPLARAMEGLVTTILDVQPGQVELHGCAIFQRTGRWKRVSVDKRVEVYSKAIDLLAAHECVVAHSSIDKPELKRQYATPGNPYLLALQFLCEKLDKWARIQQGDRSRILLVADETKEQETGALSLVADMQRWGSPIGSGISQLKHVIDTMHFVSSRTNPGVQLADLVAYVLQRQWALPQEPSKRADLLIQDLGQRVRMATRTYRETWPSRNQGRR